MYRLEDFKTLTEWPMAHINEKWVAARPLIGPLQWRIEDAIEVLMGKADAFKWPEGQ